MAEVSNEVIQKDFKNKIVSITDFRREYAGNISSQGVNYAIENDLVDYIEISSRVRLIVLTEKTLKYVPNESPKRTQKSVMET